MDLIMFRSISPIFLLCNILTPALSCDWVTFGYRDLRNTSLIQIETMGGEFSDQECTENKPISFPYDLCKRMEKREVESQLRFIRDSLKQIYELYRFSNLTSAAWDAVETERFLTSVDRQIKELNSCVSKSRQIPDSRLRKYYRSLKNWTLLHTGSSSACWDLLRKQTKDHLVRLEQLGNLVRKASRGRSAAIRHH